MSPVRATVLQLSLDLQLRTLQLSRYARSKRTFNCQPVGQSVQISGRTDWAALALACRGSSAVSRSAATRPRHPSQLGRCPVRPPTVQPESLGRFRHHPARGATFGQRNRAKSPMGEGDGPERGEEGSRPLDPEPDDPEPEPDPGDAADSESVPENTPPSPSGDRSPSPPAQALSLPEGETARSLKSPKSPVTHAPNRFVMPDDDFSLDTDDELLSDSSSTWSASHWKVLVACYFCYMAKTFVST